jgi:hypothetical protein
VQPGNNSRAGATNRVRAAQHPCRPPQVTPLEDSPLTARVTYSRTLYVTRDPPPETVTPTSRPTSACNRVVNRCADQDGAFHNPVRRLLLQRISVLLSQQLIQLIKQVCHSI